tara:strand:- start:5128 stop:5976 length:849 start_codon:yes stop_codon:yes gene_type:complete
MSLNFCHITPTAYLDIFATGRKCHLLLAHLVNEDEKYRQWYVKEKQRHNFTIILDNSAFEMFKRNQPMYDSNKLLDAANKCNADYVVMTDYPNEDYHKTIEKAKFTADVLLKNNFKPFFCPQSNKGDLEGLIKSYFWAKNDPRIRMIGFSILAIPNAYGVLEDPLQRFLSRWRFVCELNKRGFFEDNTKKLHMLGMLDGPNEIGLMKEYLSEFSSWDSSAAVWAGLNGIEFDDTPTGLIDGKFEKEVDFNHNTAMVGHIAPATRNLKYIDGMIDEVFRGYNT